jgi:stearoyl-CoA desaturase (delta-9 desaturase)
MLLPGLLFTKGKKMFSGFIQLTPKAVGIAMAISFALTIIGSELYLHRSRSHRAITFHPVLCQLFRMWFFLTTFGLTVKAWVAVHRKHHAKTDTVEDPHSPVIHGLGTILTKGVLLYRKAALDPDTIKTYGVGIKDDWMDTNLYTRHRFKGAWFFLLVQMALFGAEHGLYIWLFQLSVSPVWAAGFSNGFFHTVGYRNFDTREHSRNFFPIAIIFCGAELHNNHHAHPASAKASVRWWEFDSGWLLIRVLAFFRLVTINRVETGVSAARDRTVLSDSGVKA